MINLKELWVLEWSLKQKCFHIETVGEMVLRNIQSYIENYEVEYIPVYFCNTQKEASVFTDRLRKTDSNSSREMKEKWDKIWRGEFE